MRLAFKVEWTIPGILLLVSCSSVPPSKDKVELTQSVKVLQSEVKSRIAPKGSLITLSENPLVIETAGKNSVLLTFHSNNASYRVLVRPGPGDSGLLADEESGLNELISGITEIQVLLSKGKGDTALLKANSLDQKYPGLSHLKFLKASCLVVLGKAEMAKTVLEEALAISPHNKSGRHLYELLSQSEAKASRSTSSHLSSH